MSTPISLTDVKVEVKHQNTLKGFIWGGVAIPAVLTTIGTAGSFLVGLGATVAYDIKYSSWPHQYTVLGLIGLAAASCVSYRVSQIFLRNANYHLTSDTIVLKKD